MPNFLRSISLNGTAVGGGASAPAAIRPYNDASLQFGTLPGWVFDSGAPVEINAWGNRIWYTPFLLGGSFTVNRIHITARSDVSTLQYRVGITALSDNPWQPTGPMLYRSAALSGAVAGPIPHTLPTPLVLGAGLYAVTFISSDWFPLHGRAGNLGAMGVQVNATNVGIISDLVRFAGASFGPLPDPMPTWDSVTIEAFGTRSAWIFLS